MALLEDETMIRNEKGTTIVEVLMAFVIVVIGIAAFTTALGVSSRVTNQAIELRRKNNEDAANYFGGGGTSGVVDSSVRFSADWGFNGKTQLKKSGSIYSFEVK